MIAATTITATTPSQRVSTATGIGTHRFAINTRICPMPITGTGAECMLGCSLRLSGRRRRPPDAVRPSLNVPADAVSKMSRHLEILDLSYLRTNQMSSGDGANFAPPLDFDLRSSGDFSTAAAVPEPPIEALLLTGLAAFSFSLTKRRVPVTPAPAASRTRG